MMESSTFRIFHNNNNQNLFPLLHTTLIMITKFTHVFPVDLKKDAMLITPADDTQSSVVQ